MFLLYEVLQNHWCSYTEFSPGIMLNCITMVYNSMHSFFFYFPSPAFQRHKHKWQIMPGICRLSRCPLCSVHRPCAFTENTCLLSQSLFISRFVSWWMALRLSGQLALSIACEQAHIGERARKWVSWCPHIHL